MVIEDVHQQPPKKNQTRGDGKDVIGGFHERKDGGIEGLGHLGEASIGFVEIGDPFPGEIEAQEGRKGIDG